MPLSLDWTRRALHIMLRDLLTQKFVNKFLVTDFGYPRAEKLNRQIDLGPPSTNFFQNVIFTS
jgi:hypothetical protein